MRYVSHKLMDLNSQWYCLGDYGTSSRSLLAGGGKSLGVDFENL